MRGCWYFFALLIFYWMLVYIPDIIHVTLLDRAHFPLRFLYLTSIKHWQTRNRADIAITRSASPISNSLTKASHDLVHHHARWSKTTELFFSRCEIDGILAICAVFRGSSLQATQKIGRPGELLRWVCSLIYVLLIQQRIRWKLGRITTKGIQY